MNILSFLVRLCYINVNGELQHLDKLAEVQEKDVYLSCLWPWIVDEESGTFEKLHDKVTQGFNSDDLLMEVTYHEGFVQVEILTDTPFETPVPVYDSCLRKVTIRPLIDWIKISIDGALSDGVGENSVGFYKHSYCELFLDSIISDEPHNERYFIGDTAIKTIEDIDIELPGYKEKRKCAYNLPHNTFAECNARSKALEEVEIERYNYILSKLQSIIESYDYAPYLPIHHRCQPQLVH